MLRKGPFIYYVSKEEFRRQDWLYEKLPTRYLLHDFSINSSFMVLNFFEFQEKKLSCWLQYNYRISSYSFLPWIEGGPQNLRQLDCSFTTISSHFFAIYINIFHKNEVQTVILRCWTGLYLDWFMNYDTKRKYICFWWFLRFLLFCVFFIFLITF